MTSPFNLLPPTETMSNGEREAFAHFGSDHWSLRDGASWFGLATREEASAWVLDAVWPGDDTGYFLQERARLQDKIDKLNTEYEIWSCQMTDIIAKKHEEIQRLRSVLQQIGWSTEEAAILRGRAQVAIGESHLHTVRPSNLARKVAEAAERFQQGTANEQDVILAMLEWRKAGRP